MLLCASLLALSGCSAPSTTDSEGHLLLVNPEKPADRPTARVAGDLALVGDHCFGLDMGDLGTRAVVFPAGSRITADDRVDIPGLGTLSLGEAIDGGGGYVASAVAPVTVPSDCAAGEVAILNPFN